MTIGAFVVTRDGAALITPVVRCLQQFADRVLVCIDSRSTDNTCETALGLGADVITYEFKTGSYESALNQCVAMLDTDWLFYLHDDELVGPDFIDALPRMMQSNTAWRSPHYNLWPDPEHYITTAPYYPDYQMRLIRRGTWIAHGGWTERVHTSPAWPCQFATCGIFHYKFIVKSQALREERLQAWIDEWAPAANDHYRAFSVIEGRDVQVRNVPEPAAYWGERIYA